MDSISAMMRAELSRGKELKVFDWDKAAKIISERKPKGDVSAGLSGDLEWTAGVIYSEGKIIEDSSTYLASTWATPVLIISNNSYDYDEDDGGYFAGEEIDCYRMQSEVPDWNSDTKWPESSKAIINEFIK